MPWYPVIKRIKNRPYLYMQTTYRESGKVKTKNRYIGPAGDGIPFSHEPRAHDAVTSDLEKARVTRDVLRDTLENHPAKFFIPLRGDLNKQSIGGDTFAELNYQAMKNPRRGKRHEILKHLDTYLSERGFADFEELDASVEEYFRLKEQHEAAAKSYARLKQERADAWKYHVAVGMSRTPESVIRTIPEPKPQKAPVLKMRTVPVRVKKPRPPPKPAGGIKVDPIRRKKPINVVMARKRRARAFLKDRAQAHTNALRRARMSYRRKGIFARIVSFQARAQIEELKYENVSFRKYLKLNVRKRKRKHAASLI